MVTLTTKPTKCYIKYYTCIQDKSLQSCPTLCNPMNCSPPDFSVHRISQARVMEWVAISFFRRSSNWGTKPTSPAGSDSLPRNPWEAQYIVYVKMKESESCSVVSESLRPLGLYSPWNSPGKNTAVGSLSLFQGIFPTQGSNPGLLHCRQILYQLSHEGSPRILAWVTYPFSSGSSWPRNWTGICIVGRFFTNWAIREAQYSIQYTV